ncbi:MAG: type I restriction enzyme HsdR N-terminal domain-containing protein, partial [Desulfovibrionaceae bacterium]|nr:type I restriction enzyme HsdR N-terminal domain-containing protein [Desulfovibrionaceae bacterium]
APPSEDIPQALAKLLVEEKKYPKPALKAKIGVCFPIDGKLYPRMVDLAAYADDGSPLMIVVFCSGEPGSYRRESLAAARLHPGAPAPLVLVTDTKDAYLLATADGAQLGCGLRAIPAWDGLAALAAAHPVAAQSPDRIDRERRILYAYSELLEGCGCPHACRPKGKG